jgi:hypothetical protein
MGGTISAGELAESMTKESALNFIRMMRLAAPRRDKGLDSYTEEQWVDALTRWHLSYNTPRPVHGEIA